VDKNQVVTKSLVNMLKKFITAEMKFISSKKINNKFIICNIAFYHCMRGKYIFHISFLCIIFTLFTCIICTIFYLILLNSIFNVLDVIILDKITKEKSLSEKEILSCLGKVLSNARD